MSEIILHHFDASPFAEKIRLALGLKGLAWRSVTIPMVMPKPLLTALTGGYRKTPVLQIGADIHCDTAWIAAELERRFPAPTLFPGNSRALAMALAQWSDVAFFRPGAALSIATNSALPPDVIADRRAFFAFLDFDTLAADLPHLFAQFRAQLDLLARMLADGRRFVLGAEPGWADILCYFPLWMCRGNIAGGEQLLRPLADVAAWETRVRELGHGEPRALDAADALAIARGSAPDTRVEIAPDAYPDAAPGAAVRVTPDDYGAVPVAGELLRLTHETIAIRRTDPLAGEVVVNFPRAGYRVELS